MRAAADVPFNYTETEWSTIERALPSAHLAVPLTEDEKSFLRAIAERFLRPQSERASGRNKLWSELARVCGKAEALLAKLKSTDQRAIREPLEAIKHLRRLAERESMLGMDFAELQPESARLLNPRTRNSVWYQGYVLAAWQIFGGKLRISRNPVSGEVGGPLWRFFEAVARPVMGEATPAASSFPDIVDRQKRHDVAAVKWFQVAEAGSFDDWLALTSRRVRLPARRKPVT